MDNAELEIRVLYAKKYTEPAIKECRRIVVRFLWCYVGKN